MSHAPVSVTPPVVPTKLCYIVKRPNFEGYGFNLHSEKMKPGQFIGKVDANSPAEQAGLKKGDRIIEVNGVAIGSETHKQVVQRIKAIENEVRLLLIDVDGNHDSVKSQTKESSSSNGTNITNDNYHDSPNNSDQNKNLSQTTQEQNQIDANGNGTTNVSGLHLPLTAAEMRAKLMSRKKYDPKNESVDIKKKFQIVQTL